MSPPQVRVIVVGQQQVATCPNGPAAVFRIQASTKSSERAFPRLPRARTSVGWSYRRPVPCAGRSVAVWGATKRQAPRDGLGFQPAVVRAHRRASALSPMPPQCETR